MLPIVIKCLEIGLVATIAVALWSPNSARAEQWICETTQSSGFTYDKASKEWRSTVFRAGDRYVISPTTGALGEVYKHSIRTLGQTSTRASCKDFQFDWLRDCKTSVLGEDYMFNRASNDFIVINMPAFVFVSGDETKEGNTPYVAIGKCSPF